MSSFYGDNGRNVRVEKGRSDLDDNDESWRRFGLRRRKSLLEEDEESGGSTFTIHRQTNIKRYFEVADRVRTSIFDHGLFFQNLIFEAQLFLPFFLKTKGTRSVSCVTEGRRES